MIHPHGLMADSAFQSVSLPSVRLFLLIDKHVAAGIVHRLDNRQTGLFCMCSRCCSWLSLFGEDGPYRELKGCSSSCFVVLFRLLRCFPNGPEESTSARVNLYTKAEACFCERILETPRQTISRNAAKAGRVPCFFVLRAQSHTASQCRFAGTNCETMRRRRSCEMSVGGALSCMKRFGTRGG